MKRWSLLVAALLSTACTRQSETREAAAPFSCGAAPTAIMQRLPKSDRELPTTNPVEYLAGLDGQVEQAQKMVVDDPTSATKRLLLASLLGARGKLFGDLDQVQAAIDATSRAIELAPDDAAARIERANIEQTLHRFDAARADLAEARRLGGSSTAIAAIETELDWNQGNYDKAIPALRNPAKRTWATVSRMARLAHDLGEIAEADRLYAEAEDLIDDTSPVPVAFLNFQRGFHAFELGRIPEAIVFYREAVRRLPTWITAQEHLAEVLVISGNVDEAVAIYQDVTTRSRDPELMGALAAVYRSAGRIAEADLLDARARAGFDEYEKKYPEAAYGHASEYYLQSDPKRALAMREANVRIRPNGMSWAQVAESRLAVGDHAGAREAIDRALASPLKSAYIEWTAARILGSRAHAEQACTLDPRSSIDLPPITSSASR
jgi:tetratricopeptide (TPR) repeat protein